MLSINGMLFSLWALMSYPNTIILSRQGMVYSLLI